MPFPALVLCLLLVAEPVPAGQCPSLGQLAGLHHWCGADSGLWYLPHGGPKSVACEGIFRTSKSSLLLIRVLLWLLKSLDHFPFVWSRVGPFVPSGDCYVWLIKGG